jgi:hypothetical protein
MTSSLYASEPLENDEPMYRRREIIKEEIVISNDLVNTLYNQLIARNTSESTAHNTFVLDNPRGRQMHEKRIIAQAKNSDYEEFNEMLKEWAIVDEKRNGPTEKAIWDDQDRPTNILRYITIGTISASSFVAALKFIKDKAPSNYFRPYAPEILEKIHEMIAKGAITATGLVILEKIMENIKPLN